MADLQECLQNNDLCDLPNKGVFYTWSNHRPEDPILWKLDRTMVNDVWLEAFPESVAIFDPPGDSDHAPCLINLDSSEVRSKKNVLPLLLIAPIFSECSHRSME
ncbi:hypothetical protein V5N11_014809 [Cardamine amara subsp. amara]|uniref:Endonuclease/exonuclease/phosphatase domain-containing protein n=1 Tax=Cardamine amara subsp. amara TaxID=228776 RepID=A0ABD1A6W9_CARAN